MGSKRNERLKELFLQEISVQLRNVNGINTRGILTLTGAKLTSDGKVLYVFYSVLGSEEERKRKELLLAANVWDIRSALFKRLRLKVVPEIVFKFDDTPEKASHIEKLLNKIRSEHDKTDENP
ncbi:MAG: ribosome-binding factor A [Elusimicrobiales bacterium]